MEIVEICMAAYGLRGIVKQGKTLPNEVGPVETHL